MDNVLISVVIPVHNGARFIKKTAHRVLSQSLEAIELVLVENFSKDDSFKVCCEIASKDHRVVVTQSFIKGTSYARKKGIELAKGKYIFTCDQDDRLIDENALQNMYDEAEWSGADIIQFNYYKEYLPGIKRKEVRVNKPVTLTAGELRKNKIRCIFVGGCYSTNVWSKLFRAEVLKDAVKYVNDSLFFAEDMNLNVCCMFSSHLNSAYLSSSAYYIWRNGTGFTSSLQPELALMEDYNKVKPKMHLQFQQMNCDNEVFIALHSESLLFMKYYMIAYCKRYADDDKKILNEFQRLNEYQYIQLAKNYFVEARASLLITDELLFLSKDYSCREFKGRYQKEIKEYGTIASKASKFFNAIKKLLSK